MSMLNINDVTLLAISSIEIPETIWALQHSKSQLNFGAVKLVSDIAPRELPIGIDWEYCPHIRDIMDFNYYVFNDLYKHVNTPHCLMVQYHAYILHPELWEDSWLEYDYIGAPWPVKENSYIANNGETVRVGNGGFSLRSRKLMELPNLLGLPLTHQQGYFNEDGNICCYYRREFLANGIKYAPLEVAARFSFETLLPENKNLDTSFGFHRNKPR
jgi:hypothetical protein